MKSREQRLLEEAYEQILIDEKINWKGALTAAAMAATSLLGGTGTAKADVPSQGIEQAVRVTAEDLIPQKEFEQVLDMMRQAVAKGDLKSAKQIYNIVNRECSEAAGKVQGNKEIHKLADMDATALKIFNDAYLGVFKGGIEAMADAARGTAR